MCQLLRIKLPLYYMCDVTFSIRTICDKYEILAVERKKWPLACARVVFSSLLKTFFHKVYLK